MAKAAVAFIHQGRQPVRQKRWRGRFPNNVVNRRAKDHWQYLNVGDEAVMNDFSEDHGKRVVIKAVVTAADQERLKLEGRRELWFVVEAVGSWKFEYANGERGARVAAHCREQRRA
jgi:hypothetical protein